MSRRSIALLALILTLAVPVPMGSVGTGCAARNPFIASKRDQASHPMGPASGYPSFLQPLMQRIAQVQQRIKQQMVRLAGDIRQHPWGTSFRLFMLLSFIYGVIHALGPGHGKIYACSYFLSRPGTFKKGLLFGNLTMLFHVLSGSALILAGALILKTSGAMTLESAGSILEKTSYALLTGLGFFFMGRAVWQLKAQNSRDPGYCPDTADLKSLVITALAVGIVPCPGAALILLFCLTLGILTAGLAAMICIAAGMAITTSLFAVLAIGLQKSVLALAEERQGLFKAAYATLSFCGAACIAAVGGLLFLGSF